MVERVDRIVLDAEYVRKTSVSDLLKKLVSSERGLSNVDVGKRLEQYGYNEIPEKRVSPILKFIHFFWGPILWMIETAAFLSAIVHRWTDFSIIGALLLVNAIVGFWEERKGENAIELLKQKLAVNARVLRDGKWRVMGARELVPGDIARVRLGDIVPADIRLVHGDYLMVDQSALTGESLPVEKHVEDIGYAGSIVRQGEMNALVVATGSHTYFGKTAKLVEEAKTQSHLQKAIIKIGDYLIVLAIGLVGVIFLAALFRHASLLETLQFALILTVAAIPAALPAVLSVTLAVGAIALAKKEAIVSKLTSIEEMAGVDILCCDKTGTITKNELTVSEVKPFGTFTDDDVLRFGFLASREEDNDPIDNAIIAKAKSVKAVVEAIDDYKVSSFKPFDPVSKRTEVFVERCSAAGFKVTKGAPQVVLQLASDIDAGTQNVEAALDYFAGKGYRAIGVAKTDLQDDWRFVGLVAIYDPPRDDSAETISAAQSMGVHIKMITGDHVSIAKEIARRVGLGTNIVSASSILSKKNSELEHIVEVADGFAQVFPEHKYRIVEFLQSKLHIVGMTGDGVNDAPALKKADAGIAVAGATDAAKSAAEIVLTRPGLSAIVDATKESRKIFQRMNNYAIYRIAETIRILFFITFSILVFRFYPVTALMIVLLMLLNDIPIMTIAYDNVRYSNQPEKWNLQTLLTVSTILGFVGVLASFGLLYIGVGVLHLSREILQSFIYLKLSVAGHLLMFVARTKDYFWSIKPAKPLFLAIVLTQITATLITVYGILLPAMGWILAGLVWGYSLAFFLVTEAVKIRLYRFLTPR
jgi:H+-transporting ATPase